MIFQCDEGNCDIVYYDLLHDQISSFLSFTGDVSFVIFVPRNFLTGKLGVMTLSLPVPIEAALEAVKSSDTSALKKFVKGVVDFTAASLPPGSSDSTQRTMRQEILSARDSTHKKSTLLHWAAYLDNLDAAKILIHFGADVDMTEADGKTPLHWAGFEGNAEMVQLLLRSGANYELLDDAKQTACHLAIINQHVEVARLFPNYQAIAVSSPYIPLEDPDPDFQTPFRPVTPRRVIGTATTTSTASTVLSTVRATTTSALHATNDQAVSTVGTFTGGLVPSRRSSSDLTTNLETQLERPLVVPSLAIDRVVYRSSGTSPTMADVGVSDISDAVRHSPLYEAICSTAPPIIGARAVLPPPPKPILSAAEEGEQRRQEKERRRAERRLRKADKRRELIHELVALYAVEEARVAKQKIHWLPPQQVDPDHQFAGESPERQLSSPRSLGMAAPGPSRVAIPSTRFPPDIVPTTTRSRPTTPRAVTPHYRPPWKPPSAVTVLDPVIAFPHQHADPQPMKKLDVRSY